MYQSIVQHIEPRPEPRIIHTISLATHGTGRGTLALISRLEGMICYRLPHTCVRLVRRLREANNPTPHPVPQVHNHSTGRRMNEDTPDFPALAWHLILAGPQRPTQGEIWVVVVQ